MAMDGLASKVTVLTDHVPLMMRVSPNASMQVFPGLMPLRHAATSAGSHTPPMRGTCKSAGDGVDRDAPAVGP